jgi:hypothetical protein
VNQDWQMLGANPHLCGSVPQHQQWYLLAVTLAVYAARSGWGQFITSFQLKYDVIASQFLMQSNV